MTILRVCCNCKKDMSEGGWFFAEGNYFCNVCFDLRLKAGKVSQPMHEFTSRNYVRPLREHPQPVPK